MQLLSTPGNYKRFFIFFVLIFCFFELDACDKNIIGAVSSPNNLINNGEVACVTGNFSGSITVNPGGTLRICGQYTFSGSINISAGAKMVITSGSSIGVIGSLTFNSIESLEFMGDPTCNAEIYAITVNSCFVTWGAAPGLSGRFCNSSNIYLDGFFFAWGVGTIGSAKNGRAPFLCSGGGSTPCETILVSPLEFETNQIDQGVLLEWSTFLENNNDYFTVERSSKGVDWEAIHSVNAKQNGTISNSYNFIDKSPLSSGTYYRIRHSSFDGQSVLSVIKYISNLSKEDQFSIFPNPSKGKFTLSLEKAHNFDSYKVIDHLGCIVRRGNINNRSKREIDLTKFDSGVYLIVISGKDAVFTRRVTIYDN